MKIRETLSISMLALLIGLLVVFFGQYKMNYYSDEIWTYGLANHLSGIYPDVEEGVKYSGYGPFETFVKVKDNTRFNPVNVYKNQVQDVHPPLYYFLINTVCSIFPDTYSKWYGIAVNLLWLIPIIVLLYKLGKKITSSPVAAFGIAAAYGTTIIFMDTMLFIRMYVQFTFFVIAISYLIKRYWDEHLDKRFCIELSLILIFGMLTHYYFLIYFFGLLVIFGFKLRADKKADELKKLVKTVVISAVIYSVLWLPFYVHLFIRHRGRQAFYYALVPKKIIRGPLYMLSELNIYALNGFAVIIIIVAAVLLVIRKKNKEKVFSYEIVMFIAAAFYTFVVGTIAPFMDVRYLMPMAWIYVTCTYLVTRSLAERIVKKNIIDYAIVALFLALNIMNFSRYGWIIPADYYDEELLATMKSMEGYDACVYLDEEWKPILFFEELQHPRSYTFVNDDIANDVFDSMEEGYFLLTCVEPEAEEKLIENLDAELIYSYSGRSYYFVH
ncbi:ArnT family glycosyltransferase [Butyrivibrio sp. XPD2006]|uniref:ArnT family glycosyltransferase n=1 Tax=Butyrivibrio sp. XPD2006 TaxID=1280668 RepID=UPI00041C5A1D|nr:glycosyltransferase family 39 protein [Butyrivibrio sp. XPD2006]